MIKLLTIIKHNHSDPGLVYHSVMQYDDIFTAIIHRRRWKCCPWWYAGAVSAETRTTQTLQQFLTASTLASGCRLWQTELKMRQKPLNAYSRHNSVEWIPTAQPSLQPGSKRAKSRRHRFCEVMPDQPEEPEAVHVKAVHLSRTPVAVPHLCKNAHDLLTFLCLYYSGGKLAGTINRSGPLFGVNFVS